MKGEKVLLVGESNPYGNDPDFALYPSPEGSAGHRLCQKILGMNRKRYLQVFDRVNLCEGKWSIKEARKKAETLRGRSTILLGAKVCAAFGVEFAPFSPYFDELTCLGAMAIKDGGVILPHPSGLCRLWVDGTYEKARRLVASMMGDDAKYLGKIER